MYRNVVTEMSPDRNVPWPKRLRPKSPVPGKLCTLCTRWTVCTVANWRLYS